MGNDNPKQHRAARGLDLPITGAVPSADIGDGPAVRTVGILASDYVGMRPTFQVKVGDEVLRGQTLFEDRKNPGVRFTSTARGTVAAIHRGDRRALQSVVIAVADGDKDAGANEVKYQSYTGKDIASLAAQDVRALLQESGLWTALRTRPFSRVPAVDAAPEAIFVTAMDSNPLAPAADAIIATDAKAFADGMAVIARLADAKPVYLCRAAGRAFPVSELAGAQVHEFSGPHPAGTVGFHIHRIHPVHRTRVVWHIGYQDVMAVGALFATGRMRVERIISVAGPAARTPSLVRTRLGASVDALVEGNVVGDDACIIAGSVLSGRQATGEAEGYLGRYHNQVTLVANDRSRRLLGWMSPGGNIFSVTRLFLSALSPNRKFSFTTDRFGGHRTLVPFASYDKVMAFDLMPVFLLRSLLSGDLETAEQLGALELDEEDLALCTFVCPSKNEYGPVLRDVLTQIEKEG